ncbi:sodium/panthothenate symporter [Escherichia coli]|uniref:Sodium/panthothenate symporter n=1 Tax=Escherichia coli TaxID=562 RepID=A0A2X3JPU7_ECOLX|nr:sodium/panthothenate symporter [Escherichia coli]
MAAGAGSYWERANAKGALSAMIVGGVLYAVLATLNIQYLGLPPYCALVTTKFAGFPGRKPFRYIRPASYRFDY